METGLIRPSVLTPAGIRIFISNLTQPAASNNAAAIGKNSTELPYGSRLMDAAVSGNCVGGAVASNAGRSIVLISKNPMTGREEVIGRDIEEVMAGVNDASVNPYLMPNDAVACYDSAVTNVREVARTVTDILQPVHLEEERVLSADEQVNKMNARSEFRTCGSAAGIAIGCRSQSPGRREEALRGAAQSAQLEG